MAFTSYYDDEVWVIVNRTIGGVTKRYVEYFKPDVFEEQEDGFFVDSGVTADSPKTITAITKANPGVVTAALHGFSNDDIVVIRGVVGMAEVNHIKFKVANQAANTFELNDVTNDLPVSTLLYTTYVSGGEVRKCSTSFSGLSHLALETVSVLADSIVLPNEVVTAGGAITLDVAGGQVHAGLPFTSKLKTMRLEVPLGTGTAQAKFKHIAKIFLRLHESLGGDAGGIEGQDSIDFGDYDTEWVALFNGDKEVTVPSSVDRDGYVLVETDEPLPFNLLAIISHVSINEP